MSSARWVASVRVAWAALLLSRPRLVLTVALGPRERRSRRARTVVLVLGARNLVQAIVELLRPSPPVLAVAAVVDALHAVSFLGFAALRPDRRWRRAVLLNVITACLFSATTLWSRHRTRARTYRTGEPTQDAPTSPAPLEAEGTAR